MIPGIRHDLLCLSVILLTLLCGQARAEDRAVTVAGTGEVLAKPNCLQIDVRASAAAELTGDAVVKYQDALRRVRGAITKLDVKNLTIEERDLSLTSGSDDGGQQVVFVGQPQPAAAKPNIHITRSLRLLVRGIDKMPEAEVMNTISALLDAAKDAGASVGKHQNPNVYQPMMEDGGAASVAYFVVEHPEELREQAYRKAFDEAKKRGERLAKLAGAELGGVVTIDEEENAMVTHVYGYGTPTADNAATRLSSSKLIDIPVRVTLRVRFALHDTNAEKGSGRK